MSKDTGKILDSHSLDNGLQVTIIDKCRLIAGDRWYMKITCVITGSYAQEQCQKLMNAEQYKAFVEKYPKCKISFEYDKERNFVDDLVKAEVLLELVEQIVESNLGYMGKDSFSENLLKKTAEEFVQEFLVHKEMGLVGDQEEVEEPDDFSACFK